MGRLGYSVAFRKEHWAVVRCRTRLAPAPWPHQLQQGTHCTLVALT